MTSETPRHRVLLVDDSLTVRMDLQDALEEAGFAVTLAESLEAARVALASNHLSAAVFDVLLPDGDGIELLTEVRRGIHAELPVILLSSEAEVRDRVRGLTTGANAYLAKPYDPAQLVARTRALIEEQSAKSRPRSAQKTVLVIDDSATFRDALQSALQSSGYSVRTAETGEEGLRAAAEAPPNAVIVDGIMPGIDGNTVVRRLRTDAALRLTPCLLLTGSEAASDELQALDAGVDAYVRKTEDMGVILARLAALVRRGDSGSPPIPRHKPQEPEPVLMHHRVLAVDDSETFLELLSTELGREGYDVRRAGSGQAALELLAVEPMECILLDLRMPGLSGEETCRRIKASPAWRDIPLIMLTAADERDAMIGGINAGADDFIVKSPSFEVVKARVRAQLRRRQFEEENRRIREELIQKELEAKESLAQRALADTRAKLLGDLEQKNGELARINRQLERAKQQAERESLFKSRFLANMSHELRTPLNAIIGFSELLSEESFGPLNQRQGEYVKHVHSSGHHLLALINDILDLSKIEANKFELRREWMPIHASIDAAWGVVATLAEKRGVKLVLDVAPGLPELLIDPVRMRQVLFNLLSNGIKFTPAGGTVRLSVKRAGKHLQLAVDDSGIGIAREDLPRLFREFEQLEGAAGAKNEGTGLGLALTKKLVELHGGTISVRSEPGKGTCFTVELPLLRRAPPSARPASDHGESESLVLVVEDDPQAAALIANHLRGAGLSVVFASSGDEALKLAEELKPSAITLDVMMPEVDGWQVLSRLKDTPGLDAIPVVIVSVVDESNRGLVLGADDYLVKPVSRESLLSSLEASGVPVKSVTGLRVLLVSEDGDAIEAVLRSAGCEVRRAPELTEEAALVPVPVDIAILESDREPPGRRRFELASNGRHHSIPVLHIFDASQVDPAQWKTRLETLARADARQPERLVRAVRLAVDERELSNETSQQPALAHLRVSIHRAQRESKRVALIGLRLQAPLEPRAGLPPVRQLLRPGDFIDVVADRTLALVAYGVSGDLQRLAARLVEMLGSRSLLQVERHAFFSFPEDGARAEELVEKMIAQLEPQP